MSSTLDIKRAEDIEGWMTLPELQWLARVAAAIGPANIFEVGCYLGRSTRAICDNANKYSKIFAIDPYSGVYYNNDNSVMRSFTERDMNEFLLNLADHIESEKLKHYRCTFSEFPLSSIKADFIFIDGDHRYEQVKKDIEIAKRSIVKGGILAGHDYDVREWPGVKQAVLDTIHTVNVTETIWWQRM